MWLTEWGKVGRIFAAAVAVTLLSSSVSSAGIFSYLADRYHNPPHLPWEFHLTRMPLSCKSCKGCWSNCEQFGYYQTQWRHWPPCLPPIVGEAVPEGGTSDGEPLRMPRAINGEGAMNSSPLPPPMPNDRPMRP